MGKTMFGESSMSTSGTVVVEKDKEKSSSKIKVCVIVLCIAYLDLKSSAFLQETSEVKVESTSDKAISGGESEVVPKDMEEPLNEEDGSIKGKFTSQKSDISESEELASAEGHANSKEGVAEAEGSSNMTHQVCDITFL